MHFFINMPEIHQLKETHFNSILCRIKVH